MSPVNPGERYPEPTKTQQAVTVLRSNAISVAFLAGQVAGIVTVVVALILVKVVA